MHTKKLIALLISVFALNAHAFDPSSATDAGIDNYLKETFAGKAPQNSFNYYAVSTGRSAQKNYSNWMSYLSDATPLSALSIPGTHNSGTSPYNGYFETFVKTQSMSVSEQLKAGIRYLDVRLRVGSGGLTVTHGGFDMGKAQSLFNQVRDFLNQNPTEAVLMRVKKEIPGDNLEEFTALFDALVTEYEPLFYPSIHSSPADIRLGDIRNQIVLLQNFAGKVKRGVDYNTAIIEDSYALSRANDMVNKWKKVKSGLNRAGSSFYNDNNLFITYTSGSMVAGGELLSPYFVASGELIEGTGRIMSPSWDPDFTRQCQASIISFIPGLCWTKYTGMNALVSRVMYDYPKTRTGIVAMDFPGATLIRQIMNSNGKDDRAQFEAEGQKNGELSAVKTTSIFIIKNLASNTCLTNSSYNVDATNTCSLTDTPNQTWRISTLSETRPTLVYNQASAQCLDAFVKPATAGTDVGSWSCYMAQNQKWTFKQTSNNRYQIRAAGRRDLCLDAIANKTKLNKCSTATSQLWSLNESLSNR